MSIRGHRAIRSQLHSLYEKDRLPHAILLSGPAGIGKHLVALEAAHLILKSLPFNSSVTSLRSKMHPDLINLHGEEKDELNTEGIRELLRSLHFKAFSGGARVIVIRDLERLSLTSANILLKSLEEPPHDVFFLLTSSQPLTLPKTILSRVHRFNLDELDQASFRMILEESFSSLLPSQKKRLESLGGGSCELVQDILDEEEMIDVLEEVLQGLSLKKVLPLAEFLQKKLKEKDVLPRILRLLRAILRREMFTASLHQEAFSEALLNCVTAERLIFDRNLNPASVLSTALTLPFVGGKGSPKILEDALRSAS